MKLNRDKLFDIFYWCWFAALLLLAGVLTMCGCLGRGCDFTGGVFCWLILTAGPAGCVFGLKYLANSENGKWYWLFSLCALAAGYVVFFSLLFAAVCAICPFDVWQQERTVFWDWFLREYDGDLAAAARKMSSPEVTGEILRLNGFILLKYQVYSLGQWAGWILTVLFAGLFFLRWEGRRFSRTCCAGLSAGLLLLGTGIFNWSFSDCTKRRLGNIAHFQQEGMKEMQKIRPAVPPEQVRKLIEAHAAQKTFGEPYWTLLREIEGKKD